MNLDLTASELIKKIKSKSVTVTQVMDELNAHIDRVDTGTNAFIRRAQGGSLQSNGLYPVPTAIKDNLCWQGMETTCASRILKGFVAPYDATVITKLKEAGCLLLGHVNMDEFAFGSSNETSCYGPVHNPWNLAYVPGGSSGGSAASVACNEAYWALGSDTGGSIRQPASFCGIVGVKPTYGRVSRYGLIAFASSLDQIGPLTKDVRDAALLLKIIAGYDAKDSTSVNVAVPDYEQSLTGSIKGLRIGIPKEYFVEGLETEVNAAIERAIEQLKQLGAEIVPISLPHTKYAVATYYIVATAEASSNLARFDGIQYGNRQMPKTKIESPVNDLYTFTRGEGFGNEAIRRILLGTYALSSGYYDAYYLKAQKVRTLIKQDFDDAFAKVDAIVCPTSPTVAFKIGEKNTDPLSMYLSDIFTIPANLSGIPGISLPCGISAGGLPIGLQIMTKCFDEPTMFKIAHAYEQSTDWHKQRTKYISKTVS